MGNKKSIFYILDVLLTGILFSMYFFPFQFYALPDVNTKMGLAAIGLVVIAFSSAKKENNIINSDIFKLMMYAGIVSLFGLISITYNSTPDTAYATYIISFLVWLSAAFVVTYLMRQVHGYLSVDLICQYTIAICVFQCIVALGNDLYKPLKMFLDHYINQGQDFLDSVHRMYGIGATLDTAGIRFSCALVMIAYLIINQDNTSKRRNLVLLIISYLIIAIIGNMIARTTSVGLIVSFLYLLCKTGLYKFKLSAESKRFWSWMSLLVICFVPIIVYLYNNNTIIHNNLRFAFEGLFNYFEKGEWSTTSTNKLMTMYVFPETLKTWLIGDGYFSNPAAIDPYFTGKVIDGYYMGTDVGYLRFIFYFGITGLFAFSLFMFKSAKISVNNLHQQRSLLYLILLINFLVWFKVATDIFLVFALFLTIGKEENDDYYCRIKLNI